MWYYRYPSLDCSSGGDCIECEGQVFIIIVLIATLNCPLCHMLPTKGITPSTPFHVVDEGSSDTVSTLRAIVESVVRRTDVGPLGITPAGMSFNALILRCVVAFSTLSWTVSFKGQVHRKRGTSKMVLRGVVLSVVDFRTGLATLRMEWSFLRFQTSR